MVPYSQLRSQPRVDLAADSPLDSPLTVYCELTNRCNLRCTMCPESHPDYARIAGGIRTMSADDLILVTDNLAQLKVRSLYLHSLGEPMLNPHCAAFIGMAKQHVERVCLTTNGTVPLTKLLDCPPDYVRVSVYGLDQLSFEKATQSTLDHRRVFDNVRELWEARQSRACDRCNGYGIVPCRDRLFANDAYTTETCPKCNGRADRKPYIYVKGFGKFSPLHYKYRSVCDEIDVEPTMDWNGEGGSWGTRSDSGKRVCPAPFYMLCIHSDLRVSVCGVDWSKRLVVGSLHDSSLADIWRSEPIQRIRMAHLRGDRGCLDGCRTCTYLHTTLPDNMDSLTADVYESRVREAVVCS